MKTNVTRQFRSGNETSTLSFPGTNVHCVVVSFPGTKVHGAWGKVHPFTY